MPNLSLWLWLLPAMMFFWVVGSYNRLTRLRANVVKAFAALDEQLIRQIVWVQGSLPEPLRGGMATLPGELQDEVAAAWSRLYAASEQFAVALAQARSGLADRSTMAGLVLAHEAMRSAWAGALQQAIAPDAVPSPDKLQARWMRLLHQAWPLRSAYNDAAQAYNDGIAQFPASIVARLVGFKPAGSVTRLSEPR